MAAANPEDFVKPLSTERPSSVCSSSTTGSATSLKRRSMCTPKSASNYQIPRNLQRQSISAFTTKSTLRSSASGSSLSSSSTPRHVSPYQYSSPYPPSSSSSSSTSSLDSSGDRPKSAYPFQHSSDDSFFSEETMSISTRHTTPLSSQCNTPAIPERQSPSPQAQLQRKSLSPVSALNYTTKSAAPTDNNRLSLMSLNSTRPASTATARSSVHSVLSNATPEFAKGDEFAAAGDQQSLHRLMQPPLEKPVVLPQAASGSGLPFTKAYAPILENYNIDQERFYAFIDGLNEAVSSSSQSKPARYLGKSNDTYFKPRGLKVDVLNSEQLADRLGFYDWSALAAPLTPDQMDLTVEERKVSGISNRVSRLEFMKIESTNPDVRLQNRELIAQRRRTMVHQDWFNPVEELKKHQKIDDKETAKKVKRLSEIQLKADKKRAKSIAKLDKSKAKEISKMKKSKAKDMASLAKDNRKATQTLSKQMKKELDPVSSEIKELETMMNKKQIAEIYIRSDPSMMELQRQKRSIINRYHGLMDQEMQAYELEKKRREREFDVEMSDYEKVYQENHQHLQKTWDKEMGRTGSNKRDKEADLLQSTQWIVIDNL